MKNTIVILVLSILSFHELVLGATLSEIQQRIPMETNFLTSQISSTKSNIARTIDNTRSTLNSKAEGIRTSIKNGSPNCQRFEELITSLQKHQINFMYQFQPCEKNFEMTKLSGSIRSSLQSLERSVNQLSAICRFNNCQSQINSVASNLDLLHLNIVNQISTLVRESDTCINSRSGSIDRQLDSSKNTWEKCV